MAHKNKRDFDDPQPLNFDNDVERGVSDRLRKPFSTPEENRGDNEDDQYYDEEEALSPEEAMLRKKENDGENL